MSAADTLKMAMPRLARHDGRWLGHYRYVAPDGATVDEHASELRCGFRDDAAFPYHQTNSNIWADGRRLDVEYPAALVRVDGLPAIRFDTPIIAGQFWEPPGDPTDSTILGQWAWNDLSMIPFPVFDMHMFEMIQLSACGRHRSRTWHWIDAGRVVLRTLIEEERG